MAFFFILLTFHGLPIHIMRDVLLTARSFHRRIYDFLRYRNATRDMNTRYPDATAEDLGENVVWDFAPGEALKYGEGEGYGRLKGLAC